MKEIKINGEIYVPKSSVKSNALIKKGMKYVICRTYSAGVFAGYLKEQKGKEVILLNARRLWYWKGAATLSQLAEEGVKNVSECKFPQEVSEIKLTEAVEISNCTKEAKKSIDSVKIWKM